VGEVCEGPWAKRMSDVSPDLQPEAVRMAGLVREAARRSALDAIGSALLVAAERTRDAPDRARDLANQFLSRAGLMEHELSLLFAVAQSACKLLYGRRTGGTPS
jgi:hypothetical protein